MKNQKRKSKIKIKISKPPWKNNPNKLQTTIEKAKTQPKYINSTCKESKSKFQSKKWKTIQNQ